MHYMVSSYQYYVASNMRRAARSMRFALEMRDGLAHDAARQLVALNVKFARDDRKRAQQYGLTTVEVW